MNRRLLLWLLLLGFVWLAVAKFNEIQELAQTLAHGQWHWIVAALALQVLYYIILAALYQAAFATVDVRSRVFDLLPVTFASIFVNVMAPSGGASGAALFVDDAARRGESAARAAVGTILMLIADFSAFTVVLLFGMAVLFTEHTLRIYEVIAAVILIGITLALAGMLLLGLLHPERLRQVLSLIQRTVNRVGSWFRRPVLLSKNWTEKNAAEFTEAAQAMVTRPGWLAKTLAVALASHAVNLVSMYLLFLAFQFPISFGSLVAGYSMAILFLIVSPTPMGVGVVEGITPLVLISLDVPAPVATVVVLAFRGLSFWLPMGIGFLLLQRVKTFRAEEQAQARSWNVRIVAILTAVMGVINILSAILPALTSRMVIARHFLPLLVRQGGRLTAVLAGFALVLLATGLWRHKQTAWLLTMVILVASVISHLVKGLDYPEAMLAAALAMWLFYLRSHFHALSDEPSIKRGVEILAAALGFTLAYGAVGFFLLDRHFSVNFSLEAAIWQTVVMFTQFYDPGLEPITGFGRSFAASIYIVGAVTLGYALIVLIGPVVHRWAASPEDRRRAQAIVLAHGRTALARFTLFDDKSYWFSPGGSVVAFVVRGRSAIALGDPIGPPPDAAAAIGGFKQYCARNDWAAAFYQTLPDYLEQYQAAGFNVLHIGDEGILDLAAFSTAGGHNKSLRSGINRLVKMGYRVAVYPPPLPVDLLAELREISDAWLTQMHGREKRFSLGWFDDDYIRNELVIAVHTPDGTVSAFANLLGEYQRNELSVDLMRRRPQVENGTMEFLFVSIFEWAKAQGYDTFNLGLSPLAGVGEHSTDPAVERAFHFIYEHVNQFYNFKGLHGFKQKFHPDWSPRYLVYPGPASLPGVAITLNRASAGDDFAWIYLKDWVNSRRRKAV